MYRWTLCEKIVFMLPFDKSKKINIIVAMATAMVIGMVFFMSFFGMTMMHLHGGLQGDSFVSIYFTILLKFHYGLSITINYYGATCAFLICKVYFEE